MRGGDGGWEGGKEGGGKGGWVGVIERGSIEGSGGIVEEWDWAEMEVSIVVEQTSGAGVGKDLG